MTVASSAGMAPNLWHSRTVRGYMCTVLAMTLLISGLYLLAPLERAVFGEAHLCDQPFSSAMLILGLPHVMIGFLFMVTSLGMRNARSRVAIGTMLLAGVVLCWLFLLAGGPNARPRIPMALVALYFLVHSYRDEWFFYRSYGEEGPRADRRHLPLMLSGLLATVLGLLWTLAITGAPLSRDVDALIDLQGMGGGQRMALWLIPLGTLGTLAWVCIISATRRSGRTLSQLFADDRPLWFVYLTVPLMVLVCAPLGGKFHALVLLHVIGWWVFASVSLNRTNQKPRPARGLWIWLRTTQSGFQTLHGVSAVVVLGLLLFYFHSPTPLQDTAWSWFLDRDAFYYWTVMHVTVSFVPKS